MRNSASPENGNSSRKASADGCALTCPACGSQKIQIYNGFGTERIAIDGVHFLASCLDCGLDCKVVDKEARRLSADDLKAMRIDTDRSCDSCGYNLKSLSVGHPCPECGNRIPFPKRKYRRSPFVVSEARWEIEFAYAAAAVVIFLLFRKPVGDLLLAPLLGGLFLLRGILAIYHGSLRQDWGICLPLITGRKAKFHGVGFVALGLLLIVLPVLHWFGIVP